MKKLSRNPLQWGDLMYSKGGGVGLVGILGRDGSCQLPCCLKRINYRAGETVYSPGDPSDQIYYIYRGRVKLSYLDESGRRVTLAILGEGEIFGELALVEGSKRTFLATVWEDTCICPFDRSWLRQCLAEDPKLALWMLQLLGHYEQRLMQKLFRLHFQSVPRRLAQELLELVEWYGEPTAEGIMVRITHQELADLIGAARETTSVALHQLRQQGFCSMGSGRAQRQIVISDLTGLDEVAKGQCLVSIYK